MDLAKPGHRTTYLDLQKKNVIEYNIGILTVNITVGYYRNRALYRNRIS